MRENWEHSVAFTFLDEKGNDNDPVDAGGRTSDGITQKEFNAWCTLHSLPSQDIWTVPWETKKQIYFSQYWMPYCDNLPTGMDYLFFDTFVNSGLHEAALLLQRVLGVAPDGHIGVLTLAAAKAAQVDETWIDKFCSDHERVYNEIIAAHPQDRKFLRGWENRIIHERVNARILIRG